MAGRLKDAITNAGGITFVIKALGKPRATIDRWMNAQASPSLLDLADVAKLCKVSLEWLITGEGNPKIGIMTPSHVPDVIDVPILDARAAAGGGALNGDQPEQIGTWPFAPAYLRSIGVLAERAVILHVSGDSMVPTLRDGDAVMIDTGHTSLKHAGIFALTTPDGLIVKRIARNVDGSLTLISDNKDFYPPERLSGADAAQLRVLGRVHWYGRLMP